jgi:hypothetical protein
MASVLLLGALATVPLERALPEELRHAPHGVRAQEPVALTVAAAEQDTARVAG